MIKIIANTLRYSGQKCVDFPSDFASRGRSQQMSFVMGIRNKTNQSYDYNSSWWGNNLYIEEFYD